MILIVFLISACLADPDVSDEKSGSPAGPTATALATLKVVDNNDANVVDYTLQILAGAVQDEALTDVSGEAVMTVEQNGDNVLENLQDVGSLYMDTFVYLRPTAGTEDFRANPILAPWSDGSLSVPANYCYDNYETTSQTEGGFLRVYKSSGGALFQGTDVLTLRILVFSISTGGNVGDFSIDSGANLVTSTTAGMSYIDIWASSLVTGDSSGHRDFPVQAFSFSDLDKTAQAEVTLNGVTHTVEFAPCGAFVRGVLSIVYF